LSGSIDEARKVLQPYPAELMTAYRVRPLVNNSKNKGGDELIEPIA
jgi:putative SOS response-associated peptidase YedK